MLELPDYLREEAGIPAGAKLCVYVDDEEKTVTIAEAGYDHDLRDVPPYLLEMLPGRAGGTADGGESHLRRTHRMQWAGGTRR